MKYKIPFIKPSFPRSELIAEDYLAIIDSNWFTNFGPFEQKFSTECARFLGSGSYVTTVANATLGLQVAVMELFDKTKPLAIMPDFTFAAGAEVLISEGFKPVFIDVKSKTWQPDYSSANEVIIQNEGKVGGILLCNIFGVGNHEIHKWEELAKQNGIPLIIDTAAGFGSMYSELEMVGSRGDCEVFSLHATKPFAVGEGGLIVSRNEDLIKRFKMLENFGFDVNRNVKSIGTNAKMQELNAAIGIRQLDDYESRLQNRREVLSKYKEKLTPEGFVFQENDSLSTVPFASVLAVDEKTSNRVHDALHKGGVEARSYYTPLHTFEAITSKAFAHSDKLSNTTSIASRILSLPVHDDMKEADINYVTDIIISNS